MYGRCGAIEIDDFWNRIYRCMHSMKNHKGPHMDDVYGEWVGCSTVAL